MIEANLANRLCGVHGSNAVTISMRPLQEKRSMQIPAHSLLSIRVRDELPVAAMAAFQE